MIDLQTDCRLLTPGKSNLLGTISINFDIFSSFNQLDLPAYETYDKLRTQLLKAVRECSEGFGFA